MRVDRETEPRLRYRPGLDGLRALAVAGVFVYHARIDWLPGGFLGVDLFFVLSGYLITSLLLAEWERLRRVDLRRFWLRRARRLLPAVVVVVLAALVAAAVLAPDDFARTRGDAAASLLYVTNWHLVAASHSYFESVGRPSLLLHLWSLAVEEQFYVLWPLLLVAALALRGRRAAGALVVAGAAGSTALMWLLYDPERDPSRVYYGTDTRAATLLVGALLAVAWPALARIRLRRGGLLLDLAGVAALVGVLVAFRRVHDFDPGLYRGGFLAFAVCAGLLIAAVAREGRLGDAVGRQPLRWLGVRSYGIYLWHWPVLALTRPGVDVPWRGWWLVPVQAALVVALAAASYRFVEQPIRSGALQQRLGRLGPATLRRGALAATAAGAAGVVALLAAPAPATHPVLAAAVPPPIVVPTFPEAPPPRHPRTRRAPVRPAPRGPVLAVGDSVMLGCSDALERALGRRVRVDAVVGRQVVDVVDRLAAYRARGALPKTVVVQVGDNGPAWYADLARLRKTLAGTSRVVLVNVRVDRSWQGEVNHELDQFATAWRKARIADWHGASSDRVLEDGVHPTPQACTTYARVIADALRGR